MKSIDIPGGVIGALKDSVNDIIGLRDDLGAALMPVYIVTRAWSGEELGGGDAEEVKEIVDPSPRIVSMNNDSRILEGGAIQLGDIMLKMISKANYEKSDLDGESVLPNVQRFYEIDGELYTPITITEKHLYWNVLVRKAKDQRRYNPPAPPEPDPEDPPDEEPDDPPEDP